MIFGLFPQAGFGTFMVLWTVLGLMGLFVLCLVLDDTKLPLTTRFKAFVTIILIPIMLPLYALLCIGGIVWVLTYPIYVFAVQKPYRVSFIRYVTWDF